MESQMNLFDGRSAGKPAGGFGSAEWAAAMKRATGDFQKRQGGREKRFPRRDRREPQTGGKR